MRGAGGGGASIATTSPSPSIGCGAGSATTPADTTSEPKAAQPGEGGGESSGGAQDVPSYASTISIADVRNANELLYAIRRLKEENKTVSQKMHINNYCGNDNRIGSMDGADATVHKPDDEFWGRRKALLASLPPSQQKPKIGEWLREAMVAQSGSEHPARVNELLDFDNIDLIDMLQQKVPLVADSESRKSAEIEEKIKDVLAMLGSPGGGVCSPTSPQTMGTQYLLSRISKINGILDVLQKELERQGADGTDTYSRLRDDQYCENDSPSQTIGSDSLFQYSCSDNHETFAQIVPGRNGYPRYIPPANWAERLFACGDFEELRDRFKHSPRCEIREYTARWLWLKLSRERFKQYVGELVAYFSSRFSRGPLKVVRVAQSVWFDHECRKIISRMEMPPQTEVEESGGTYSATSPSSGPTHTIAGTCLEVRLSAVRHGVGRKRFVVQHTGQDSSYHVAFEDLVPLEQGAPGIYHR